MGLGIYFTIRSGVVQVRLIPEMFRTLTNKTPVGAYRGYGQPEVNFAYERLIDTLARRGYRHIPVVDDGGLVGILSMRDLMKVASIRPAGEAAMDTLGGVPGTTVIVSGLLVPVVDERQLALEAMSTVITSPFAHPLAE